MCSASSTGLDSAKFRGIHVKEKCAAVQRVTAWPLSHLYHELDPRTPPRPRIDQTRSKGTPRRHKTPKRIQNPGIKAPHESIHEIQEELKSKNPIHGMWFNSTVNHRKSREKPNSQDVIQSNSKSWEIKGKTQFAGCDSIQQQITGNYRKNPIHRMWFNPT